MRALRGAIIRDHVAHAYLFTGVPGTGRHTLATAFAQALNCERTPGGGTAGDPCLQCRSCRKIARRTHPDVRYFDLATQEAGAPRERTGAKNTSLSIETIRAVQTGLNLRPFESQWAMSIVADAESMRGDAAAAFLKTLEEPPPFAIVILIARDAGAVLPTIRSRCQLVELHPVDRGRIEQALVARHLVAAPDARALATMARGRPGWAMKAMAEPDFLAGWREAARERLRLLHGSPAGLSAWSGSLADRFRNGQREETYQELDAWVELWRDILLVRAGCAELVSTLDDAEARALRSASFDLGAVYAALAAALHAGQLLDQNVAPRLVFATMARRWAAVVIDGGHTTAPANERTYA